MTLKIGALSKLGLFFPGVCFIYAFDQTLAEQLYSDKGLYSSRLQLSQGTYMSAILDVFILNYLVRSSQS